MAVLRDETGLPRWVDNTYPVGAVAWQRRRLGTDLLSLSRDLESPIDAVDAASAVHLLEQLAIFVRLGLGGVDDGKPFFDLPIAFVEQPSDDLGGALRLSLCEIFRRGLQVVARARSLVLAQFRKDAPLLKCKLRLCQRFALRVFLDLYAEGERQLLKNVAVQFHVCTFTTLTGISFQSSCLQAASRRAPANSRPSSSTVIG
jgi:hypothetical protein